MGGLPCIVDLMKKTQKFKYQQSAFYNSVNSKSVSKKLVTG